LIAYCPRSGSLGVLQIHTKQLSALLSFIHKSNDMPLHRRRSLMQVPRQCAGSHGSVQSAAAHAHAALVHGTLSTRHSSASSAQQASAKRQVHKRASIAASHSLATRSRPPSPSLRSSATNSASKRADAERHVSCSDSNSDAPSAEAFSELLRASQSSCPLRALRIGGGSPL